MPSAVIIDTIRTPLGRRNGRLREWHPVDLAAETLRALADRTGIDPAVVDDVVLGCVMQVGEQSLNVARNAVLAAGWPDTVPGTTVPSASNSCVMPTFLPMIPVTIKETRFRLQGSGFNVLVLSSNPEPSTLNHEP